MRRNAKKYETYSQQIHDIILKVHVIIPTCTIRIPISMESNPKSTPISMESNPKSTRTTHKFRPILSGYMIR